MLFTCATLQKTNPVFIHSFTNTDIYLLRNTRTFPSAIVHVMHNLNITVLSPEAPVKKTVCQSSYCILRYSSMVHPVCTHSSAESVSQNSALAKAHAWHSLVLIIHLLLGKGRLGVLFQGVAYPGEGVHLLGTAGRHGELITAERTGSAGQHLALQLLLTRLGNCLTVQVQRHQRQRGPAPHSFTYSLSHGQQFLPPSFTI